MTLDLKMHPDTFLSHFGTIIDPRIERCKKHEFLDVMGCQKDIAQQIVRQLALKGNDSGMQAELEAWCYKQRREGLTEENYDQYEEVDSGHDRIGILCCEQLKIDTDWLHKDYRWPGQKNVIRVKCTADDERLFFVILSPNLSSQSITFIS